VQTDTSNVSSANNSRPSAEVRKFMFDRSFDVAEPPKKKVEVDQPTVDEEVVPEVVAPTFSEEEMKAAREEAFAAGKKEGAADAHASTEREILVSLNGFGERLKSLSEAQDIANASVLETAIIVAVGVARKLFPALNEKHALGEIERMVSMAMERVLEEPKIVLYVNSKLKAGLDEHMAGLAAKAGFKGDVTIEGVDDIIVGDCRVEWTGGGARRHTDELWQEIDAVIERNLGDGSTPAAAEAVDPEPESRPVEAETGGAILDSDGDKATDREAH
jgi:flagellar assembly protein FliH